MFRTVPLSIIRSLALYTQQWYMSYRFAASSLALNPLEAKPSQAKPSQAKPSQTVKLGAETKHKSTSRCLLAIPASDRTAGLSNRHLNSNRGLCLR